MKTKENKKAWDTIFKEKGKFFEKPHRDISDFIELLKKRKLKRVLDLGCGSGRHTVFIAGKGFDVCGIDNSDTAIDITKKWLRSKKLSAELTIRDIYRKLPYEDDFFDAVVSIQVIHHARIGSIRKLIKEINRVLKKGGYLFVTVPIYSGPITGVKKNSYTMKRVAIRTYIPLDGIEKGLFHYFFKEDELKKSFDDYKILKAYFDNTNHFCLIAQKKKS